jgi:hypothetical protein
MGLGPNVDEWTREDRCWSRSRDVTPTRPFFESVSGPSTRRPDCEERTRQVSKRSDGVLIWLGNWLCTRYKGPIVSPRNVG